MREDQKLAQNSYVHEIFVLLFFAVIACLQVYGNEWLPRLEGDTAGYHLPSYQFTYRMIHGGELSLWISELWGGVTALHSLNFLFSPIVYLFAFLFTDPQVSFVGFGVVEKLLIFHLWLFQVGAYYLLKNAGVPRLASAVSVVICGAGAYLWFPRWFDIYISMGYAPGLLAAAMWVYKEDKPLFSWRNIVLSVILSQLLLQQLGQAAALILFAWGVLYVFYMIQYHHDRKNMVRITLTSIFSGIIGVGLAAVSVIPTVILSGSNSRLINDLGFLAPGEQMPFWSFVAYPYEEGVVRNLIGGEDSFLSISIAATILIVMGFFSKVNTAPQKIAANFGKFIVLFCTVGGLGLWFCDFLYYIPVLNQVRQPFLYCVIFSLGSSILGGIGLEAVLQALRDKNWKQYFYNPTLMKFIVCSISLLALLPHRWNVTDTLFVALMMVIVLVSLMQKEKATHIATVSLCLALSIISAVNVRMNTESKYTVKEANEQMETVNASIQQLLDKVEPLSSENMFRITEWGTAASFPINSGVFAGYNDISDYWNPIYEKTINKHLGLNLNTRFALENVKYWFSSEEDTSTDPTQMGFEYTGISAPVYNSYDAIEPVQVDVYKNTNYLGPAWFVYDFQIADENTTDAELLQLVNNPELDVSTTAVLASKYAQSVADVVSPETPGKILAMQYTDNTIEITCSTETEGLLMLTESDAPGWKAWVDGEKTDILSVNYDRKGIVVPAGEHEITLRYLPDSLLVGVAVTSMSVIASLGYIVFVVLKKRSGIIGK